MKNATALLPNNFFQTFDIAILTETMLLKDDDIPTSTGLYSVHSLATPTLGRPSGGVSILLKPTIGKIKEITKEYNAAMVKTENLTIVGMYLKPETTEGDAVDSIMKVITEAKNERNVIIAGDFNGRIDKPDQKTEIILETMQEEGFTLINKPELTTYIAPNGSSAIDLVFL